MDTLATLPTVFDLREPIPGYHLRERIGSGGYGEVWRADAPGGLAKAVKIVFGPLSAGRADRELKALNRIKQVQHPLLLSLERIEMVEDHLVIVMELAHGSLKDRFEHYKSLGLDGIPRDELLVYLRDAADALDYLYQQHTLQHLDVKPENLLLIANRVKVADFGLVKDLHDNSASLTGGLTPLYAPPEVFDGRPNRNSDQYSLAMVYQELLTGEPAFGGRTLAQLAAQHLHSAPCLAALPKADQPVIARALAKDPDRRFPNCRALIDSLSEAPKSSSRSRSRQSETTRSVPTSRSDPSVETRSGHDTVRLTFPQSSEVLDLPPLELPADLATSSRPCVFIGVGHTGALVLQSLRQRLSDRVANVDNVSAWQMLLLDTDKCTLTEAVRGDHASSLRSHQLVPLGLRPPQDYRADSAMLLEWLSRRWLYNIPRSLLTEGIRALGRLAFVDHFSAIAEAVSQSLRAATSAATLAASSQQSGLTFVDAAPRVFVVASSAGGTGSGMVLDLGYLIRTVLEELRLSEEALCGVLVHATSRRASARDLAVANSLCLINELRHYSSDNGYPGEPTCHLPPRVGNSAPFRSTYFLHLGDELSDEELKSGAARVAEYLYQSSVSTSAALLDRSRASDEHRSHDDLIRTFGVTRIGACRGDEVAAEGDHFCSSLLMNWAGSSQVSSSSATEPVASPAITRLAHELLDGLEFSHSVLSEWADETLQHQAGEPLATFARRLLHESLAYCGLAEAATRRTSQQAQSVCQRIDHVLFSGDDSQPALKQRVSAAGSHAAAIKAEKLRATILALVEFPEVRLPGTSKIIQVVLDSLRMLETQLQNDVEKLQGIAEATRATNNDAELLQHVTARLRSVALTAMSQLIRSSISQIRECDEQLGECARRLRHLANELSPNREATHSSDAGVIPQHSLAELMHRLDQQLTAELRTQHLSLAVLVTSGTEEWNVFASTLRSVSCRFAGELFNELQVNTMLHDTATADTDSPSLTTEAVQAATPRFLRCGGARRLLLVAPAQAANWPDSWTQAFADAAQIAPQVLSDTDKGITVCCEVQDVPLQNIAAFLVGPRRDFLKAAARLHTRIDVDWPSLESWLHSRQPVL